MAWRRIKTLRDRRIKTPIILPPEILASNDYIPGPKLRDMFGISAVTLWRWQHMPHSTFPRPVKINNRNYFQREQVMSWIENQQVSTSS